MNLIVNRGYRNTNAKNRRGGYQESSIVNVGIYYHRNGHSMRPNKVLECLNF
jgi:hypothetical protein